MKKLEQIKNDLLKEKKQVEKNIAYYREMRDNTEDVTTREMYERSLEYARGRWYGLERSLTIIESYK